jgi:hypothetical protein
VIVFVGDLFVKTDNFCCGFGVIDDDDFVGIELTYTTNEF